MVQKKQPNKNAKPSLDPDSREKQLVNLAVNEAEKQLKAGTASSAVIVHYLKLGTQLAKAQAKLVESQASLAQAKAESIKAEKETEASTEEAINAMKTYSGAPADDHD